MNKKELMAKFLDDFKAHTLAAIDEGMDENFESLDIFLHASLDVFLDIVQAATTPENDKEE